MTARLRQDVEALAAPGERVVGGKGHAIAREYLLGRIAECGLEPYHGSHEWPYEGDGQQFTNLLARLPGVQSGLDPILLAAHYDTCGEQPGADDNAAAVAILLDTVEPLRAAGLERDVIFAFFDAEEPPYYLSELMGSTYFYDRQRKETTHCAIVLDLCGHDVPLPGFADLLFVTGLESSSSLEQTVLTGNDLPGLRTVAIKTDYIGDMSDYRSFRRAGRPFLFLSCAWWEHYHMETDTPDRLNYEKMQAIRDYVVHAVQDVASRSLESATEFDSTPTEVRLLREHLGPMLAELGIEVRTRADVDQVAAVAINQLSGFC